MRHIYKFDDPWDKHLHEEEENNETKCKVCGKPTDGEDLCDEHKDAEEK